TRTTNACHASSRQRLGGESAPTRSSAARSVNPMHHATSTCVLISEPTLVLRRDRSPPGQSARLAHGETGASLGNRSEEKTRRKSPTLSIIRRVQALLEIAGRLDVSAGSLAVPSTRPVNVGTLKSCVAARGEVVVTLRRAETRFTASRVLRAWP